MNETEPRPTVIPLKNKQISPALVYLFFFGSGFAALLYQIVWLKYLNLLFGSTTYATAAVVAAFMCGLSLGSRIPTRFPAVFSASLKTYGLIEMGIGIFALSFPYLYSGFRIPFAWIFNLVGPQNFVYNALTFLIAFIVLVIPTAFMGATLPLLSHYLISEPSHINRSGTLYAINTAGAVFGILCSAFVLIPNLGLNATVHFGVLINLAIGLLCYLSGKQEPSRPFEPPAYALKKREPMLYAYAFSGLAAIGYEVLWTRLLVLHLGSSVYAYAIMLAVFLIGISMGSYVSGKWMLSSTENLVDRNRSSASGSSPLSRGRLGGGYLEEPSNPPLTPPFIRGENHYSNQYNSPLVSRFSWIQIALGVSILIQILQFASFSKTLALLAGVFGAMTATKQFLILFLASFQLLILPTFLSGTLFPVVVAFVKSRDRSIEEAIALSYSYNTVGGISGSLLVGFLLLPVFGTQVALFILAGLNLLLGITAQFGKAREAQASRLKPGLIFLLAGAFLLACVFLTSRVSIIRSAGIFQEDEGTRILHLEEDTTATISVEKRAYLGFPYESLSVNGVNVAGTSPGLIAIQKMQAHVPLILFGPSKPKKVLHIGFGSGGTAYSASLYPDARITVVEISRGIVRNADAYFRSVNHGVASSGKVQFIYFDGRSYLQNTSDRYDVILSDSIHPRYAGNGSFYTRDYYQIVYNHLNTGGVHSQWIPIYSVAPQNLQEILKAFSDVFEDPCVWYVNSTVSPFIIVTGRKQAKGVSLKNFQEAMHIEAVEKDLKGIGIFDENFFLDHFLFGPNGFKGFVGDVDPHIDDLLSVEYESSRITNRSLSWWINFRNLLQFREPVYSYLASSGDVLNREVYNRFYAATGINLTGHLYLIEGKFQEAKKAFAEALMKNEEDREPFEYVQGKF